MSGKPSLNARAHFRPKIERGITMEKMLQEYYDAMIAEANKVADAMNEKKSADDIKAAKKIAKTAMDKYNDEAAKLAYRTWAAENDGEKAVEIAIRTLYIPGAKSVTYKAPKDSTVVSAKVNDAKIKINLVKLAETIGKERFHSEGWFNATQKLAYVIANRLNKSLGNDPMFQYAVDEAAKEFQFPADADPTSNNSIVKALQTVVDGILYIPETNKKGETVNAIKMENKHWTVIRESMTNGTGEPGQVGICGTGKMSELVADEIYVVLNKKNTSLVAG